MRLYRSHGDNLERDENGNKQCNRCFNWLEESKFGINNHSFDSLNPTCLRCCYDRVHKLSFEQREKLLAEQNFLCGGPGCNRKLEPYGGPGKTYCIDHDHTCCSDRHSCGKCIRGLLCKSCNREALSAARHIAWFNYCMKYEMEKAK